MADQVLILPAMNLQVLESLSVYRFLTSWQLLRLEVASHIDSLYRALRRFEGGRRQCVGFADFGTLPRRGRLPRIYYLTRYGAELLADAWRVDPAEIAYPKGARLYARDYFHRTAVIDFEIELRRFADCHTATVDFFHRYFDCEGANRNGDPQARLRRLSKVPLRAGHFIPDALFAFTAPDGSRFLFALEVYNGADTKRVHASLKKHMLALSEGAVSDLYRFPHAHRVLSVFETESALQATVARLLTDPAMTAPMRRQFAFSTLPDLRQDFVRNWRFITPELRCIFDPHP